MERMPAERRAFAIVGRRDAENRQSEIKYVTELREEVVHPENSCEYGQDFSSDGFSMDNKPKAIDEGVGSRIRLRRQELSISQSDLAEKLGVTSERLQQCECGSARIGASRLQRISEILDVPVMFFFRSGSDDRLPPGQIAANFEFGERRANALEAACAGIDNRQLRGKVLALVQSLRDQPAETDNES